MMYLLRKHDVSRFARRCGMLCAVLPASRIGTARDFCRFDQSPLRVGRRLSRSRRCEESFSLSLTEDGQIIRLWEVGECRGLARQDHAFGGQRNGTEPFWKEDLPPCIRPFDAQHGARRSRFVFQQHFFCFDHISLPDRCACSFAHSRNLFEKTIALFAYLYYNY